MSVRGNSSVRRNGLLETPNVRRRFQTILKVEEIGDARGALNTAQNKLQTALRTAAAPLESSRDVLQRYLTCAHARRGTD